MTIKQAYRDVSLRYGDENEWEELKVIKQHIDILELLREKQVNVWELYFYDTYTDYINGGKTESPVLTEQEFDLLQRWYYGELD